MPTLNRNPLEDLSRQVLKEVKKLTGKELGVDKFTEEDVKKIENHVFPNGKPTKLGKKIIKIFQDIPFLF